jgi:hypothetical protein
VVAQKQNGGKPTIITKRCLVSSPAQINVKKLNVIIILFHLEQAKLKI